MQHELTIKMKFDSENPPKIHNFMIYLDDEPVGCVQKFKLSLDTDSNDVEMGMQLTRFGEKQAEQIEVLKDTFDSSFEKTDGWLEKVTLTRGVNFTF